MEHFCQKQCLRYSMYSSQKLTTKSGWTKVMRKRKSSMTSSTTSVRSTRAISRLEMPVGVDLPSNYRASELVIATNIRQVLLINLNTPV